MIQVQIRTGVRADNFVPPPRNQHSVSCIVLGLCCKVLCVSCRDRVQVPTVKPRYSAAVNLWRCIGGGCKSKYCVREHFCSQTFIDPNWGWRYMGVCL
jgi:hypothetical protein